MSDSIARLPLGAGFGFAPDTKMRSLTTTRVELAHERATALGLAAKKLRATLTTLAAYDQGVRGRKGRARLLEEAADSTLAFLVQREAMGLDAADAAAIRREYSIPADVWNSMGALRESKPQDHALETLRRS